jgi:hypothetical protein
VASSLVDFSTRDGGGSNARASHEAGDILV